MIKIIRLSKEYAFVNYEKILSLEDNWEEIGDKRWTKDNLLLDLPLKWKLSHIALSHKKIMGYQIGSLKNKEGFLNKILVGKRYRNKSVGKKLIKSFLCSCLENKLNRVSFRVRCDNSARDFYEKIGFIKADKKYKRTDEVIMYNYNGIIGDIIKNV